MKKQMVTTALVLLALLVFGALASMAVSAQAPGPTVTVTVTVDEGTGRYRASFSGVEEPSGVAGLRFRFDLSDSACKDPGRLAQGGSHVDRVIYGGQVAEAGGRLERSELIGPDCPFHVKHIVTVRLWDPYGVLDAQASAVFCRGGCGEPTATAADTVTPTAAAEQSSNRQTSVAAPRPRTTPEIVARAERVSASKPDAGRYCIPTHAGAPVRLCPTGSRSGWWIYDSETGQILQDGEGRLAYVPFPKRLRAGQAEVIFASERLIALWLGNQVVVWTRYADGKAYVFSILVGGRVAHWQW